MINDVYVEFKSAFFPQYKLNVFVNIIIKEANRPVSQSEPVLFSGEAAGRHGVLLRVDWDCFRYSCPLRCKARVDRRRVAARVLLWPH